MYAFNEDIFLAVDLLIYLSVCTVGVSKCCIGFELSKFAMHTHTFIKSSGEINKGKYDLASAETGDEVLPVELQQGSV